MGDFKHLCWKIITAPLNITGCVQHLLRTNSGQQGHSQKELGLSKGQCVALMQQMFTFRESFHQHQAHIFKAACGIQLLADICSQWQWCSHGLHHFASRSCSCPDYFMVMNTESYKKTTRKVFMSFQMCKWIYTFMGTELKFFNASCCILG